MFDFTFEDDVTDNAVNAAAPTELPLDDLNDVQQTETKQAQSEAQPETEIAETEAEADENEFKVSDLPTDDQAKKDEKKKKSFFFDDDFFDEF